MSVGSFLATRFSNNDARSRMDGSREREERGERERGREEGTQKSVRGLSESERECV